MASPNRSEKTKDNRFIIVENSCRPDEELGRVCKAFYDPREDESQTRKRITNERYVTLLLLHDWYAQLNPTAHAISETQRRLKDAVEKSKELFNRKQEQLSRLIQPLDAVLFDEDQNNYVVLRWVESVELNSLLQDRIHTTKLALKFTYELAETLDSLYWLTDTNGERLTSYRPTIALTNIVSIPHYTAGMNGLVLADWGYATTLDQNGRTEEQEQEDAQLLVKLLLSLLDGILFVNSEPATLDHLRASRLSDDIETVRMRYVDKATEQEKAKVQNAEIWIKLNEVLTHPRHDAKLNLLCLLKDVLKDSTSLAAPLESVLSSSPKETGSNPSTNSDVVLDVETDSADALAFAASSSEPPALEPTDLEPTDLEPTDIEPTALDSSESEPFPTSDEFAAPVRQATPRHPLHWINQRLSRSNPQWPAAITPPDANIRFENETGLESGGKENSVAYDDTKSQTVSNPPTTEGRTLLKIEALGKAPYLQILPDTSNVGQGRLHDQLVAIGASLLEEDEDGISEVEQFNIDGETLRTRKLYIFCHQSIVTKNVFYTISDLGYEIPNRKTVIDGQPLSPLYGALLTEKTKLEIDDTYDISLERRGKLDETEIDWVVARERGSVALQVLAEQYHPQPTQTLIEIPITVFNPTDQVDRLTVIADGTPVDWQLPQPQVVRLFDRNSPESSKDLTLRIPLPPKPVHGEYNLSIRLISDNVDSQVAVESIQIVVPPRYEYTGNLFPVSIRVGDFGELRVENHGNIHQEFRIQWRDQAGELLFMPEQATVGVPPLQTANVGFRPYVRRWRYFGRSQDHSISATVTPHNGGMPQTFNGQVRSRPLIPAWAPWTLLFLLVGGVLLYTFLFAPNFTKVAISAQQQPAAAIVGGASGQAVEWSSINGCFYSLYQNGQTLARLQRQRRIFGGQPANPGTTYQQAINGAAEGDKIELRLHGCTLLRTNSWEATVVPAPTDVPPPPMHPQIANFELLVENVESAGFGTGGIVSQQDLARKPILVGQTGDFCVRWDVTNDYNTDVFQLIVGVSPQLDALAGLDALTEPTGKLCIPIANNFFKQENYTLGFGYKDTRTDEEIILYEQGVALSQPACSVNTGSPLWIREGPGREYLTRGQLLPGATVFPLSRPFRSGEEINAEPWVQISLLADPRPVWIAYNYLFCPVSIDPLPAVDNIPEPPTPTPTPTPAPTATPLPIIEPEVSLEPPIINQGGCALLTWKIVNVQEVYLNNLGVVGESELQVCPDAPGEYEYNWRIVNLDGSTAEKKRTLLVNPNGDSGPLPPPTQQ